MSLIKRILQMFAEKVIKVSIRNYVLKLLNVGTFRSSFEKLRRIEETPSRKSVEPQSYGNI